MSLNNVILTLTMSLNSLMLTMSLSSVTLTMCLKFPAVTVLTMPISAPIEQSQCDENMQCSTHESPSDIAFTNMLKSLADKNGCSVL